MSFPSNFIHRFPYSMRPESTRHAALWLLLLSALTALPCYSRENAGSASPNQQPTAAPAPADAGTLHRYHLPRSNNYSIYFLPGSAELGESARQVLADTAARLNALPHLVVMLEGYADEFEEAAYGPDLRKARVEAMIDELHKLNIPKHRIVTTIGHDSQQTSVSCISEYCRQSYRRVRLEFSRTSGH